MILSALSCINIFKIDSYEKMGIKKITILSMLTTIRRGSTTFSIYLNMHAKTFRNWANFF